VTLTDAALAADLARDAGELLLQVWQEEGFWDPYDLGDAGDKRANTLILDGLARERPADAVLSEEAVDDLSRVDADRVWIVDPLDGTWEFSTRRNDWAVHIALWQRGDGAGLPATSGHGAGLPATSGHGAGLPATSGHEPGGGITDAAVALPAFGEVYRTDTVTPPAPRGEGPIRITASASRPPAVLWRLADQMDVELVRIGSAGAKAMAVVSGEVDAYLHAGGQWEWDSAAPAGVVRAAGLHASRLDGSPLIYNRRDPYLPDLLMCRQELAEVLLTGIRSVVRGGPRRTP
jgi:3'(2'), 5'-bisphosphate nucleotidase